MILRRSIIPLLCCAFIAGSISEESLAAEQLTFETDIRPILKANCFHCHGEEQELAGGLDLRMTRLIVAGGDSGPAIEAGDHSASLLHSYVESGLMPPAEEQHLKPEEVALIARWIDQAARTARPEPEETPVPGELLITTEDRDHWSFRPLRKPEVPEVTTHIENPIDAFVARKHAEHRLTFSRTADKITLLRRACFDLLGLPPTREQVEEFVNDESNDAYEKLIDRLLASPHYGERWGRHWLDVVGYADSEGYNDKDVIRDDAWSYRDYVIRAFNDDQPWNQFIVEQLAGDELAQVTHANAQDVANANEAARTQLVATGYLRMVPDGSGSSPDDPLLARNQVVTDTIKIVSSSLLGLTVGCAECHHHRFDPIPQEDFYRLRALFEPVYDLGKWRTPEGRRVAILSAEERQRADEIEAKAKELDAEHARLKQETLEVILGRVLEEIPEEQRAYARETFETPKAQRSAEQIAFSEEQFPMVGLLSVGTLHLFLARFEDGNELMKPYEDVLDQAKKLRATKPQPTLVRVATEDTSHLPETHVFHRGDVNSPGEEVVQPGGLKVISQATANVSLTTFPENNPELPTSGRRLAYAHYLTTGKHPLVARVLVNRFWLHHFGRGLVETPGEFGLRSSGPSHPELLDWLASDFQEHGWRLKRLHKLMMTSRTYRQASYRDEKYEQIDSDNRLLWRMPVRRLESEVIRDAILAVSGTLSTQQFGPAVPVIVNEGGIVTVGSSANSGDKKQKRSIYIQVRRSQPVAMLDAFDAPQLEPNCEQRVSSTVATQSLTMLNSQFIIEQSREFAERVLNECGVEASPAKLIEMAWQLALADDPSAAEMSALQTFLEEEMPDFKAGQLEQRRAALSALCQVLLNSNRFLYID